MPHILVFKVQLSVDKVSIYTINAYNAPIKSKQARRSIDVLIEVSKLLYKCVLIMRDFNLYHTNWDNCTINPII